jgi:exoribonuclease II
MAINCWLEQGVHYWEGTEKPQALAIKVPPRPSARHVWDGSQWQDNTNGIYFYDKPNFRWALKSAEEIAAINAELTKKRVLEENLILVKFAKILLLELDAIRAGQVRPQAVKDFIDAVKEYL